MNTAHVGTSLGLLLVMVLGFGCTESKSDPQVNLIPPDAAVGDSGPHNTGMCKMDGDCVLAPTVCCACGPSLETTKAVLKGQEDPPNCQGLNCGACPETLGPQPSVEAYCEQGACKAREVPSLDLDTECKVDADCRLISDCCACGVGLASDTPVSCLADCAVGKCEENGIERAICSAGRCLLGRELSCRADRPICLIAPPNCADGELPGVEGACFTGTCVKKAYCAEVSSCADCEAGSLCMTEQHDGDTGETFHCMPIPSACESGTVNCACAGQLCAAGGFKECNTTETGIRCAL